MHNLEDYRPGIGIMLQNSQGLIFIGKRKDMQHGAWQMPQGGVDEGENIEAALFREMKEEIGTDKATILKSTKSWIYYDLPQDLQKNFWGGRYKGQRQKWFLLNFDGKDEDINVNTTHPEFIDWRWERPENLVSLVVNFKKKLYVSALQELTNKTF